MSVAFAAETIPAGAAQPFYAAPDIWVMVAFLILVTFTAKRVGGILIKALDDRSEGIRRQIEEATRLRDEAQELLASYQRKQRDAIKEADDIVEHAKREAERLTTRAAEDLERSLNRRERLALDRIAQAETKALDEVRALAIDVALEATRRILAQQVTGAKADALIDDAIKGLSDKLH